MKNKNINILIVEDDYNQKENLKNHLENIGYTRLLFAKNSQEALAYFKECSIQLSFLDVGLVDSELDGIELGKRINEISNCKIVFTTSFTDHSTIDRSADVENHKYLAKPINERDIAVVMRTVFRETKDQKVLVSTSSTDCELIDRDLLIKGNDKIQHVIKGQDLLRISTGHAGISIHTINGVLIFNYTTLASFMRQYNHPDIIRIHKGHAINKRRMKAKYEGCVILEDDTELPIGETWRRSINEHFNVIKPKE